MEGEHHRTFSVVRNNLEHLNTLKKLTKRRVKLLFTTIVRVNKNSNSYIYKGVLFIERKVEVTLDLRSVWSFEVLVKANNPIVSFKIQ